MRMSRSGRVAVSALAVLALAVIVALAILVAGCGTRQAAIDTVVVDGSSTTAAQSTAAGGDSSGTANTGVGATTTTANVANTAGLAVQSTTSTARATTTTKATTQTTAAEKIVLTVTGPTGSKTYTLAQLKAKASATGYWGAHKPSLMVNGVYPTDKYRGVPLSTLLAEVGGIPSGRSLNVNTSDNFACEYDAARLADVQNGTYQIWNKTTGAESVGKVTLIVAYEMNGAALPSSTGPLRLVPVTSSDGWVSEGKYSPYWVTSVAVE